MTRQSGKAVPKAAKFDKPAQTASGRDICEAWRELQDLMPSFYTSLAAGDLGDAKTKSGQIRLLQKDIGLRVSEFEGL